MSLIEEILPQNNYHQIKLSLSKTQHLFTEALINGKEGLFIIDTGASNSCIDFKYVNHFKVLAQESDVKAAGAGATDMLTEISKDNNLQIGSWSMKEIELVLFDLSHVNLALEQYESEQIHGIIGADILLATNAVIDYETQSMFLKLQ